jgi:hypothetical protein
MTSGESGIASIDGGVSLDDLAALLALANTFEMLGSWSSYKKTHVGKIARLEPSLDNSSMISFFPIKICRYPGLSKLFTNLQSSWQYSSILSSKHDHYLLSCLTMSNESSRTLS